MADIMNEHMDGVDATAESTGASVENCRLVGDDEMTMALSLANSVLFAAEGEADFDEPIDLATMFGAYQNSWHVVVPEDSDVESMEDLEGLDVSVGAPGSGTEVIGEELLEWYGLSFDDINVERLSFAETSDALLDENIDAGFWSVAYPASSIEELASQRDVRLLDFPESDVEALESEFGYYANDVIPAGTYPGQDEDVRNPGMTNVMITRADADEDFVHDLVEVIYENLDTLENVHPAAEQFEETARETPIEHHPGAERYFDEAGL